MVAFPFTVTLTGVEFRSQLSGWRDEGEGIRATSIKDPLSKPRSSHPFSSLTGRHLGSSDPHCFESPDLACVTCPDNIYPARCNSGSIPLGAGPDATTRISWVRLFFNNNVISLLLIAITPAVTTTGVPAPRSLS